MSSFLPQFFATLGATLGAFSLGNVLSWTATAVPGIKDEGKIELPSGTFKESMVVSIFMLGAAAVPAAAVLAFPRIGKKWFLICLALPFVAGWLVLLFASEDYWMLLLGRFLTGFSGGAFVLAAPAYSAEIAETKYRGTLGTMMQVMVTLGIFFINVNCSTNWQVLSGICITFPSLLALWMFFMPRSPVFLVSKGQMEEAKKALQFFRGKNANVETELKQIEENVKITKEIGSVGPLEIWQKPQYLKPFGISLALMALQQLSGINYIMGFSTIIFESSGSSIPSCTSAMILGAVQVIFSAVTSLVIDRFGRKILLLISETTMCVAMVGMTVYFKLREACPVCISHQLTNTNGTTDGVSMYAVEESTVESLGWLPLVSLIVFITGFSLGLGPIPWVINVEVNSPEARSLVASICTSFNWLVSFVVVLFIPSLGNVIHPSNCYLIFAAICAVGVVFILLVVPETKGKTEAEIRNMFSSKKEKELGRL